MIDMKINFIKTEFLVDKKFYEKIHLSYSNLR